MTQRLRSFIMARWTMPTDSHTYQWIHYRYLEAAAINTSYQGHKAKRWS